jgi:hypothetical protein
LKISLLSLLVMVIFHIIAMKNKKSFPENKFCNDCLIPLTEDNSKKYNIKRAKYICTNCHKQRDRQKYQDRKELIREQQRLYDLSIKIKVIEAYGGKCICCNENILEFLTIGCIDDQINDKKSGGELYRWLIKNNYPKDNYQVLCFNCNYSLGYFGYCPHNKPEIIT